MRETAAAYTKLEDSADAGRDLGEQIRAAFDGAAPDAVIVFSSARFEYTPLLEALTKACRPNLIVGASSAGEFTRGQRGEGTACALAIKSGSVRLAAGLGRGVRTDRGNAAREMLATFRGLEGGGYRRRSALVMTDALAGHADDLVEQLTLLTSGNYQFAGGGAGDDAKFSSTHVFFGTEAYTDAVVGLELLTEKPLGIGVGHGWSPASAPMRVTDADGTRLKSINGLPAIEAFEEHARATKQPLDLKDPLPFFLHNILGIDTGQGYRLRVPLGTDAEGAVTCAAEIPTGARITIMKSSSESAALAARNATTAALAALQGEKPGAALFFDCVATRLRTGDAFDVEIESVGQAIAGADLVGCNTYGQIARAEGQFVGFHNCTAVVMLLPFGS